MTTNEAIHQNILQSVEEHPFAEFVRILGKGKKGSRSFTREEARTAMGMILNNEVEDLQLGAFLMLVRVKEETTEELTGFVEAVKDNISPPSALKADLDWSSYAGKRRHLPWFIFSAQLIASLGFRVFMHGASGHTNNRIYTDKVIKQLGLPNAQSWTEAEQALDQHNFVYMPLNAISPRLAALIDLRSTLGLRSPVHSLSRLINPLNADAVIQGVFHPPYLALHQEAARLLKYKHTTTLKGEGGEIERNPDNDCTTAKNIGQSLSNETWPKLFAKRHVKPESLALADMISVWRGDASESATSEYAKAAVISTAAIGLKTISPELSQEQAIEKATNAWNARDQGRF